MTTTTEVQLDRAALRQRVQAALAGMHLAEETEAEKAGRRYAHVASEEAIRRVMLTPEPIWSHIAESVGLNSDRPLVLRRELGGDPAVDRFAGAVMQDIHVSEGAAQVRILRAIPLFIRGARAELVEARRGE